MSTVTNEPILLDSTGQDILTEVRSHNSYLSTIASMSAAVQQNACKVTVSNNTLVVTSIADE